MIKHDQFYWWDRTSNPVVGPFATSSDAQQNAMLVAASDKDVLILKEVLCAGPARSERDWFVSDDLKNKTRGLL